MKTINVGTRTVELKYSFNSFKYMQDLDLSVMSELDKKPFQIITLSEILLTGAMNHNPKDLYGPMVVQSVLEDLLEKGELMNLIEDLMELLEASSFFKSLQVEK